MSARACFAAALLLLHVPAGCASKESSVQLEETAFLTFAGDPEGLELQVDEGERMPLQVVDDEVRYEVAPGRRHVRVWRGEVLVVERELFVSRGQIARVVLP
jgi:hypothetical protein